MHGYVLRLTSPSSCLGDTLLNIEHILLSTRA
ncbi:hypothetical protein LINPERHAP1_LOCUS6118 [Linum perenne]